MKSKLISLTIVFSFVCFIVYGQTSTDSSSRMKQLETTVYHLLKKNKDLEARIAKLETPSAPAEKEKVVQRVYSSTEVHDLSKKVDDIKSDLESWDYLRYKVMFFFDGIDDTTLTQLKRDIRDKADSFHFH
jgi:hypothetical protein